MAGLCSAPGTGAGFLSATLAHLDCQAQTIGASGYQALASSSSPLSAALTTLLTLFVAILGIRMALGRVASLSEVTLGALKIGFVLLLATSWPAYRVIAYDLVLKAPAELFGEIGQASALPGSDGGLVSRLQAVDDGILSLIVAGSGRLDIASRANTEDGLAQGHSAISDDTALGLARTSFVAGIIAALGVLRLFGGTVLALGPLFAGLLLFDATRGLFWGWSRSLFATALGSLGISLVLSVELAVLEPWLGNVLALRAAKIATPFAPFELMALGIGFAVILFGVLAASAQLSFGSSFGGWAAMPSWGISSLSPAKPANEAEVTLPSTSAEPPSRAHSIAQSVAALERRETGSSDRAAWNESVRSDRTPEQIRSSEATGATVPLGQTYRRTARRVSGTATRRSAST